MTADELQEKFEEEKGGDCIEQFTDEGIYTEAFNEWLLSLVLSQAEQIERQDSNHRRIMKEWLDEKTRVEGILNKKFKEFEQQIEGMKSQMECPKEGCKYYVLDDGFGICGIRELCSRLSFNDQFKPTKEENTEMPMSNGLKPNSRKQRSRGMN